jgi:hypothetical protein
MSRGEGTGRGTTSNVIMEPYRRGEGGGRGGRERNRIGIMLFSAFQELERFTTTFLAQLLRTFEVTDLRVGRGGDR